MVKICSIIIISVIFHMHYFIEIFMFVLIYPELIPHNDLVITILVHVRYMVIYYFGLGINMLTRLY